MVISSYSVSKEEHHILMSLILEAVFLRVIYGWWVLIILTQILHQGPINNKYQVT